MFCLWTASSFTSRNIASAPLALALMPIHYWVAIRASQENWPKISEPFISAQRPSAVIPSEVSLPPSRLAPRRRAAFAVSNSFRLSRGIALTFLDCHPDRSAQLFPLLALRALCAQWRDLG